MGWASLAADGCYLLPAATTTAAASAAAAATAAAAAAAAAAAVWRRRRRCDGVQWGVGAAFENLKKISMFDPDLVSHNRHFNSCI